MITVDIKITNNLKQNIEYSSTSFVHGMTGTNPTHIIASGASGVVQLVGSGGTGVKAEVFYIVANVGEVLNFAVDVPVIGGNTCYSFPGHPRIISSITQGSNCNAEFTVVR